MFRRRTDSAPVDTAPAKQGGKGRPTPKRKEAEQRNRQPVTAPRDYKTARKRQVQDRAKVREGMAKGDQRYLAKRDKGPVRKLARDYVDARRTLASYFMYVMIVILIISLLPNALAKLFAFFAMPLMILIALVEGLVLARGVTKLAAERFPDEDRSGAGLYAATRNLQMRRLRLPTPAFKPGDQDRV